MQMLALLALVLAVRPARAKVAIDFKEWIGNMKLTPGIDFEDNYGGTDITARTDRDSATLSTTPKFAGSHKAARV